MTQPYDRYALRLEMNREAVRLLRLDPSLDVIPLKVIERWRTSSGGTPDLRSALWARLILERNWKQFLAGTAAGDEIRRGSPLVFVVSAAERDRIVRRYPLSPTRARG